MSILLNLLTAVLILVSLFLILVVLAQKSKDGGMGAALGGVNAIYTRVTASAEERAALAA